MASEPGARPLTAAELRAALQPLPATRAKTSAELKRLLGTLFEAELTQRSQRIAEITRSTQSQIAIPPRPPSVARGKPPTGPRTASSRGTLPQMAATLPGPWTRPAPLPPSDGQAVASVPDEPSAVVQRLTLPGPARVSEAQAGAVGLQPSAAVTPRADAAHSGAPTQTLDDHEDAPSLSDGARPAGSVTATEPNDRTSDGEPTTWSDAELAAATAALQPERASAARPDAGPSDERAAAEVASETRADATPSQDQDVSEPAAWADAAQPTAAQSDRDSAPQAAPTSANEQLANGETATWAHATKLEAAPALEAASEQRESTPPVDSTASDDRETETGVSTVRAEPNERLSNGEPAAWADAAKLAAAAALESSPRSMSASPHRASRLSRLTIRRRRLACLRCVQTRTAGLRRRRRARGVGV